MKAEPWASLEDIAQHLGVSQDPIHHWICNWSMPAHQTGRLWKFKVSEVDEWVRAGGRNEPAAAKDESVWNNYRYERRVQVQVHLDALKSCLLMLLVDHRPTCLKAIDAFLINGSGKA